MISLIIENYTKLFAGVTGKQVADEWTAIKRILVHRPSLMSMPFKRAAAKTAQAEASARCAPECPGTAGQRAKLTHMRTFAPVDMYFRYFKYFKFVKFVKIGGKSLAGKTAFPKPGTKIPNPKRRGRKRGGEEEGREERGEKEGERTGNGLGEAASSSRK